MRHVTIITTGGTIEKTYDERTGSLENRASILRRMLIRLRLERTSVNIIELMSKDSLQLTDNDRARILAVVRATGADDASQDTPLTNGVIILHGTDTLDQTGELLHKEIPAPRFPIILTGAMRPWEMTRSDALQNLTESIFATGALPPAVWCVFHGRSLRFPGVTKDRDLGTFIDQIDEPTEYREHPH